MHTTRSYLFRLPQKAAIRLIGRRMAILTSMALICFASRLSGQCDYSVIDAAQESYEIGLFQEAQATIKLCQEGAGFTSLEIENQALHLLALIAIAQDDIQKAEELILKIILNDPQFSAPPNVVFDEIFQRLARKNLVVTVSSVSKKAEDIREAPATVFLITREEILTRGYVDLIDLLSDLPGFDISKSHGTNYANIYQLGFRQDNTEKTLVMVDGVEENDIWSNIAYLSRQYPISNIKGVEVLYGPASTIYGPRAFVGAINIITYQAGERPNNPILPDEAQEPKSNVYGYGRISGGSYETYDVDFTLGLKNEAFDLSLSARSFVSAEHDISYVDFLDYDSSDVDYLTYDHLDLDQNGFFLPSQNGPGQIINLTNYANLFQIPLGSPWIDVYQNPAGDIDSIVLTPEGIDAARAIDRNLYTGNVNGRRNGFSNDTRDFFLDFKLRFNSFVLGIRSWQRDEGINQHIDLYAPGSKNGRRWTPFNATFYVRFERKIKRFTFSNLLSFKAHALDKSSNLVRFDPLGNPASRLHLAHLFYPDTLIINSIGKQRAKPGFSNNYYYYEGRQFRNDARLFYDGPRLDILGGIEVRSSQMQGDFLTFTDYNFAQPNPQDTVFLAQEFGTVSNQELGSNQFPVIDLGFYVEGEYTLIPKKLFMTLGSRVDYNRIRFGGGFGWDISPRFAVVYKTKDLYFKSISTIGSQNVSHWTRFSTADGRIPNPSLKTEKIRYGSLTAGGVHLDKKVFWEVNTYTSYIYDVVSTVELPNGLLQNRNTGTNKLQGSMLMAGVNFPDAGFRASLNYTFLQALDQGMDDDTASVSIPLGEISPHHMNLSMTYTRKNFVIPFSLNLRGNFVARTPVGPATTATLNPGLNGSNRYPAYLIFHGSLLLTHKKFPNLQLQFSVHNILNDNILDADNQDYFHPGPQLGSGSYSNISGYIPYVPQRRRYMMLSIGYYY